MTNITEQELKMLQEQLGCEQVLVKKYRALAGICTDPQLRAKFQQIAARHTDHFNRLLGYLG